MLKSHCLQKSVYLCLCLCVFLTWSLFHSRLNRPLLIEERRKCIPWSAIRKFRSPNQKTTLICGTTAMWEPWSMWESMNESKLYPTQHSLVVKNLWCVIHIEVLSVKYIFKFIHSLQGVVHMSRQMTVQKTQHVTVEWETHRHTTFISLWQ